MTYAPQIHDIVRIGKHGRPMSVLSVFPISRLATVIANNGIRHTVHWAELVPIDWMAEAKRMNAEIDKSLEVTHVAP